MTLSAFAFAVTWKSLVVMGGAALASFGMRRASAAARHLVWTLALGALLVLPAAMLLLPAAEVAVLPAPAAALLAERPEAPPIAPASAAVAPVAPSSYPAPFGTGAWSGGGASREAASTAASRPLPLWVALWTAGLLLIVARLGAGYAWLALAARRSERIEAGTWRMLAERLARLIGLRFEPPLLRASDAAMPMAWGVFRPVVLLPGGADAWPDERREVVLLHELAHIRRRDCLTQAVAQAACAIYWFNPLVWLAARRLRAERELACDDLVLQSGAEGPSYAAHLIELARTLRDVRGGALATVAMARRSELEGRLLAILNPAQNRRTPGRRLAAVLATVLVVGLLPLAAVRPVAGAAPETVVSLTAPPGLPMETSPKLPAFAPVQAPAPPTAEPAREQAAEPPAEPAATQLGSEAIDALIAALRDPDADVRRAAIIALGRLDEPRAVPGLIDALRDESADVRRHAAAALADTGDLRAVEPLMATLDDASPEVRRFVAIALGELGDRRAVPGLVALLEDSSAEVRRFAAIALGTLGDLQAVEPLIAAVGDASAEVRRFAIIALGDLGDRRAIPALTRALQDESAEVRRFAALALGEMGGAEIAEPLIGALGDTSPEVRRFVVSVLGDLQDPRAVPGLIRALGDAAVDVRRHAAYALGNMRSQAAVAALTAAVKDPDADVRRAAILALSDISGRDGIDPNPSPNPNPRPRVDPDPNPHPTRPIGPVGGVSGGVDGGVSDGVDGGVAGGIDGGVLGGVEGADVRVTQRYLVPLELDGQRVEDGARRWALSLAEHSLAFTMRNDPRTGIPNADPGIAVIAFTPEAGHRYEVETRAPGETWGLRVWTKGDWKPVVRDRTTDRIVSSEPVWLDRKASPATTDGSTEGRP